MTIVNDSTEVAVARLSWDTEFFGLSVGQVWSTAAPDEADWAALTAAPDLGLVYWSCRPEISGRCRDAFQPVEFRVELALPLPFSGATRTPLPQGYSVASERAAEAEPLLVDLALCAGQFSRFRLDPRFPYGSFHRLYRVWIERSLRGEIADATFVARTPSGDAVGLATVAQGDEGEYRIGLIAVSPEHQRLGIGQTLLHATADFARRQGGRTLRVVTQAANHAGVGLYRSFGFQERDRTAMYHLWIGQA